MCESNKIKKETCHTPQNTHLKKQVLIQKEKIHIKLLNMQKAAGQYESRLNLFTFVHVN